MDEIPNNHFEESIATLERRAGSHDLVLARMPHEAMPMIVFVTAGAADGRHLDDLSFHEFESSLVREHMRFSHAQVLHCDRVAPRVIVNGVHESILSLSITRRARLARVDGWMDARTIQKQAWHGPRPRREFWRIGELPNLLVGR